MSSVTKRISEIKQPRGGYVKPSQFEIHKIDDGHILSETENIHASVVGMAVDYLTRFAMGSELLEAFKISCMGAKMAEELFKQKNAMKKASKLLAGIKAIDEKSITNACKLVTYDVWFRNPMGAIMAKGAGNVKKCAVGKHPKSEKHGNTAQFSEVERSGTQENCGGIGSGCRLRLRPLPVLRRRQSQRVARIDPNAVVVDKNIAENDRFDLFSR